MHCFPCCTPDPPSLSAQEILDALTENGFKECWPDSINPTYTIIVNNRGDIDTSSPEGQGWEIRSLLTGARKRADTLFEVIQAAQELFTLEPEKS
jgi:hypothetical protein